MQQYASTSRDAHKQVGKAFRAGLSRIHEQSWLSKQSYSKPYGYPGDFSFLEHVYDGVAHPNSSSSVGRVLDEWSVGTGLARAVIDRKNTLRVMLEEFVTLHMASQHRPSVLSIASGAAREARELPMTILENMDLTLLDIDPRGMGFAKAFFDTRHKPLNVNTVVGDALQDSTAERLTQQGLFDLVYSFGLYDYLNDEQLLQSIAVGRQAMKSDGTFVFCLKDHRYFDAWFYDWFSNWRFFPRTIDDGYRLADQAGLSVEETYVVEGRTVCIYVCKAIP